MLLDITQALDVDTSKTAMITRVFGVLRDTGLSPVFMSADKDQAQINAISSTWHSGVVRLCLWHMQRAVDRKLAQQKLHTPSYEVFRASAEFDFVKHDFVPNFEHRTVLYAHGKTANA